MYDKIRRNFFKIKRKISNVLLNKIFGMLLVVIIPTSFLVMFVYYYPFIELYLSKVFGFDSTFDSSVGEVISSTSEVYPLDMDVDTIFASLLKPILGEPVSIKIEKANIELDLIVVGITEKGSMEAPEDWSVGGWYKNSSRPGEKGNIVINAHYDDNYGRPAAFWNLKNVKVGDTVQLVDSYGRVYYYQVDESFLLDIDDPDRLDILKKTEDRTEITLITCGGFWVPGKGTYSNRLVVKATMTESPQNM